MSASAAAVCASSASIKYPFCVKWNGGSPITASNSVLTSLRLSFGADKEVLIPIPADVAHKQKLKIQKSKVGSSPTSALLLSSEQIGNLAISALFRKNFPCDITLQAEFPVRVSEHKRTEFQNSRRFTLFIDSTLRLSLVEKQLPIPMSFVWKEAHTLCKKDVEVVDILRAVTGATLTASPKTHALHLSVVRGTGITATTQTSELELIALTEEQLRRMEVSLRSFKSYSVRNIRIERCGGGYNNPQRAVRIDSSIPLSMPTTFPNDSHLILQVSAERAVLSDLTEASHLMKYCTPLLTPVINSLAQELLQSHRMKQKKSFDADVQQLIEKIEFETLGQLYAARKKVDILRGSIDQDEFEALYHSLLSSFLDSFQDEALTEWYTDVLKSGLSEDDTITHAREIEVIAQKAPAELRTNLTGLLT